MGRDSSRRRRRHPGPGRRRTGRGGCAGPKLSPLLELHERLGGTALCESPSLSPARRESRKPLPSCCMLFSRPAERCDANLSPAAWREPLETRARVVAVHGWKARRPGKRGASRNGIDRRQSGENHHCPGVSDNTTAEARPACLPLCRHMSFGYQRRSTRQGLSVEPDQASPTALDCKGTIRRQAVTGMGQLYTAGTRSAPCGF